MAPTRARLAVTLVAAVTLAAGCGSGATKTVAAQSTEPRPAPSTGGGTHGAPGGRRADHPHARTDRTAG